MTASCTTQGPFVGYRGTHLLRASFEEELWWQVTTMHAAAVGVVRPAGEAHVGEKSIEQGPTLRRSSRAKGSKNGFFVSMSGKTGDTRLYCSKGNNCFK